MIPSVLPMILSVTLRNVLNQPMCVVLYASKALLLTAVYCVRISLSYICIIIAFFRYISYIITFTPFRVYRPVVFSIYTELCSCHHHLILEYFHSLHFTFHSSAADIQIVSHSSTSQTMW